MEAPCRQARRPCAWGPTVALQRKPRMHVNARRWRVGWESVLPDEALTWFAWGGRLPLTPSHKRTKVGYLTT